MTTIIILFDIVIWVGMAHAFWLQVINFKQAENGTAKTFGAIANFGFVFLLYGTLQLVQDAGQEIEPLRLLLTEYKDGVLIFDRVLLFILTVICVRFNSGKYVK